MKSRKEILAYTAGIIDGEGLITLAKQTHAGNKIFYIPTVRVKMHSPEVPRFINKHMPGASLCKRPAKGKKCPAGRIEWEVNISTYFVKDFLLSILPYLVLKKERAKLLLQYFEKPNKAEQIREEIRELIVNEVVSL